jgi:hypothetical protein
LPFLRLHLPSTKGSILMNPGLSWLFKPAMKECSRPSWIGIPVRY